MISFLPLAVVTRKLNWIRQGASLILDLKPLKQPWQISTAQRREESKKAISYKRFNELAEGVGFEPTERNHRFLWFNIVH
jgi:hypothetical protein